MTELNLAISKQEKDEAQVLAVLKAIGNIMLVAKPESLATISVIAHKTISDLGIDHNFAAPIVAREAKKVLEIRLTEALKTQEEEEGESKSD